MQDDWINSHKLISPERAHAVGLAVMYYNFVEDGIRSLLSRYSGMSEADSARFTYDLGVPKMADLLGAIVKHKEEDPEVRGHVEHAILLADVCRLNRNVLAHSWINFQGDKLFIQKYSKGLPETHVYDFSLEDARRVAEETWSCGHFLMFVGLYVAAKGDPHWRQSLPKKPPIPRRLMSIDRYGPEEPAHPSRSSQE